MQMFKSGGDLLGDGPLLLSMLPLLLDAPPLPVPPAPLPELPELFEAPSLMLPHVVCSMANLFIDLFIICLRLNV
jgi:hypothetical protein